MMTMDGLMRLKRLPELGATDGKQGDLEAVTFTLGNAGWVIWEYDPEARTGFGVCDLGMGFPELGYVAIDEIVETARSTGLTLYLEGQLHTRFEGYEKLSLEVPSFLVA